MVTCTIRVKFVKFVINNAPYVYYIKITNFIEFVKLVYL